MLRRQPLFVAAAPELVSSGLQPDKAEALKLLWDTAQGVQMYSGKVRRRAPSSLGFTAGVAGPIRGVAQQRLSTGTRRIWASAIRASDGRHYISYWDGAGVTSDFLDGGQLNETSLREASFADFTPLGDWMVVNHGFTKAFLFKPGPGYTLPAQFPAIAVQYIKKGPFLLALGTGPRKTGVSFSDGDNWETFTPAAENLAGAIYIDDFDTPIVCGRPLANSIAILSEDQLAAVSYIGAPYQFGQRVLLDGIGAVGKFSVTGDGKNLFGVGRGGVWWTDGNSYRYVDEGFLHDYLQENVNWSQKSKIVAGRNDFRGTIEFYFPMGANVEPSEGWSFDPRTGGWTPINTPATIMDERRLLAKPLIGNSAGEVRLIDDDPATAGALSLRTRPLLLQVQDPSGLRDVHTDTRIDEVELLVQAATGVEFRYGVSGEVDATPEWSTWQTVSSKQRTYKLEALPSGVYHRLEFRSTVTNWNLDLQGFMLFGQVEGSKRGVQ